MKNTLNTREHTNSVHRRSLQALLCAAMAVAIPGLADAAMPAPQGKIGQKAKSGSSQAGSAAKQAKSTATSGAKQATGAASAAKNDPLGTLLEVVEEARDVARSTRDQVEAIVQRVDLGASFIDGSTLEQVTTQARDAVELIKDQFEGRDAFVSAHAQQFKADLIGFLTDIQTLRHELRSLTTSNCWPLTQMPESTPLLDLVERMPVGFLYPAWKGLPDNFDCLVQDVREGVESVRTIRAILGDTSEPFANLQVGSVFREGEALSADATMFAARLNAAGPYLENYDELSTAAAQLSKMAKAAELFSAVLEALGEVDIKVTVGVHGYALLEVKADATKVLAKTVGAAGKLSGALAGIVTGNLAEARSVSTVNLILTNQEQILRNQEALLGH